MVARRLTSLFRRNNSRVSGPTKFIWNEAGYQAMQRQPGVRAYTLGRAELLEAEMKRLTDGPHRSTSDYRAGSNFSHTYPIGSSRGGELHRSINISGPRSVASRDIPFTYNVGPTTYTGPRGASAIENLNYQRFGTSKQQGRDFITDAVRNAF